MAVKVGETWGTEVGLGELTAVGCVIEPTLGADRSGEGELVLSAMLGRPQRRGRVPGLEVTPS